MFCLQWTEEALRTFREIEQRPDKQGLFKQLKKALKFLKTNPRHPSLNTHTFYSFENPYRAGSKVFEAYVQNKTPGAYRILWCYGPNTKELTLLAIMKHPD